MLLLVVVEGRDVIEWMKKKNGRSGRGDYLYLRCTNECDCASVASLSEARLGWLCPQLHRSTQRKNAALRFQSADQWEVALSTKLACQLAQLGSLGAASARGGKYSTAGSIQNSSFQKCRQGRAVEWAALNSFDLIDYLFARTPLTHRM